MGQTNNDCRFQIFILTNPHTNNVRLLEDKIQDWGMYLFTISYGSYAVDQRSGDGWISGWSQIFVFCKRNSSARFRSSRCVHNTQFKRKVSLEEQKAQKEDRFLRGRQIAYLIYDHLRVTGSHWFRRELCRPIYYCSSKWWYSGIWFEMGRIFIINDENPIWWHQGRMVQIKNTRVWETQDRFGIVQYGDSSEEVRTWFSQIEDYGKKKYRTRNSK